MKMQINTIMTQHTHISLTKVVITVHFGKFWPFLRILTQTSSALRRYTFGRAMRHFVSRVTFGTFYAIIFTENNHKNKNT